VHAWRPNGAHLRVIALALRDLATRRQFASDGLELRDLAVQFERRADLLDDVAEQRSVLPASGGCSSILPTRRLLRFESCSRTRLSTFAILYHSASGRCGASSQSSGRWCGPHKRGTIEPLSVDAFAPRRVHGNRTRTNSRQSAVWPLAGGS